MGNSSSTPDENGDENNGAESDYPHPIDDTTNSNNNNNNNNNMVVDDDPFDGSETLGYRVLGVQPNSPASRAGLVSFLDFLVGANGTLLLGSGEDLQEGEEYNDVDLPAFLSEHKNEQVEFCTYCFYTQK
jgi:GRASP55/65 PDZ-like domain